jgi:hypothetical protein
LYSCGVLILIVALTLESNNQNKISIETTIAIVSGVTQYLEDKLVAINNNKDYEEELLLIKLNYFKCSPPSSTFA